MTCNHDERFKGVFGARNGCIACELEYLQTMNEGLVNRLGAIADAFHACVNRLGVRCPACGTMYDANQKETR